MESLIHWSSLRRIAASGALKPGDRVLEIAGPGETRIPEGGLEWFVSRVAAAKSDDESTGSTLEGDAFEGAATTAVPVKDLLEQAQLSYQPIAVPEELGSLPSAEKDGPDDLCDAVLNFGGAASFFDQMGLFKSMHESVKSGGHLCHSVPTTGAHTSSWFNYNPRLFLDTAVSNQYDLVDYWLEQTGENEPFAHAFRDSRWADGVNGSGLEELKIKPEIDGQVLPPMTLTVICRKTSADSFRGAIETQTSVGEIPESVSGLYGGANRNTVNPGVLRRIARLEKELTAMKASARKGLKILEQIRSKIED